MKLEYVALFFGIVFGVYLLDSVKTQEKTYAQPIQWSEYSLPRCSPSCDCKVCVCKDQECLEVTPVNRNTAPQYSCTRNPDGTMSCRLQPDSISRQGSCSSGSCSSGNSRYGNGPVRRLGSRVRGFLSRFRIFRR